MKKEFFEINGLGGEAGLEGGIRVSGAKNAALPALASAVLFTNTLTLTEIPSIEDIFRTQEMISAIGGTVQFADGTMEVGIPDSCTPDLTGDIAKRMRKMSSIDGISVKV